MLIRPIVTAMLVLASVASQASIDASPSPSATGNFTVTWSPHGGADEGYKLRQSINGGPYSAGYSLPPSHLSKSFFGKAAGIYRYKVSYCENLGHPDEFACYDTGFGIAEVIVATGPLPTADLLSDQLDYEYQAYSGDIDGDGDQDLHLKRMTATQSGNGTLESILLTQGSDGHFSTSVPTPSQQSVVTGWPQVGIELQAKDINLDGFVDIITDGISTIIPGGLDQIVFASGQILDPIPKGIRAFDSELVQFLTEFRNWAETPTYFDDNAIWVEEPGGWVPEHECELEYIWGQGWEWYCTTYWEWEDGQEYWSYEHFNQEAYELSETFGGSEYDLGLVPGSPKATTVEQIMNEILGTDVYDGVLSEGGVAPWEIEVGVGDDDRGLVLVWEIFDTSEKVAQPGEWRVLTLGEKVMAQNEGFPLSAASEVRVYNKAYKLISWIPFANFDEQVIAPNGNIYIPIPNSSNLIWSNDYSSEHIIPASSFLHEMFHIHQFYTERKKPIGMLMWRQENPNYNYTYEEGKPFEDYGMEQQARMIRDRFLLKNGYSGMGTTPATLGQLETVIPF